MTDELTKVQLFTQIDRFLAHRRKSDGGYAKIVPKDIDDLYEIVFGLIELKCEPDTSNDRPIQVKLINRVLYEPMHFMAVPYSHDTKADLPEIMEQLLGNLQLATGAVDNFFRMANHYKRVATEYKKNRALARKQRS